LEELSFKSLELPEGTTFFVLPEVNEDNEPNIVSITSKNRSFNFNPITRVVTFNSVIHGGKEISLTRQIRPRKIHIINLMWNDNGALLNIDKDEVAEPPGFGK
jgi:hypothetical protein